MPRRAREKSKTGIYHIMVRGINRQDIFCDNEDRLYYLKVLREIKQQEYPFSLLAVCLMNNHVHMLVQETGVSVSSVMKRLGTAYALWFNIKYQRVGHVFQNRFKSEPVNTEEYLLTVLRYIHQNPIKANLARREDEYHWSSHMAYLGGSFPYVSIDSNYILSMFGSSLESAIRNYSEFMSESHTDQCMDDNTLSRIPDTKLTQLTEELLEGRQVDVIMHLDKKERNRILCLLRQKGVSIRQIAKITGLGRNIIERVK